MQALQRACTLCILLLRKLRIIVLNAHDILNIDDLDDSIDNYGKIMFPYISRYNTLTMDDFIDNMNQLFNSIK